jgi:phytoene dehydrogenase-like protein
MLGWEMSPEQLGDGRPGVVSPVRNLFHVGHWARPGGGITPVLISAMQVADLVSGRQGAAGLPARAEVPAPHEAVLI